MSCNGSRGKIVASLAVLLGAVAPSAGCGNYSNEDLEFMNALPEKQDLAAGVPVRSAVAVGDPAELYVVTRDVTTTFNKMVDSLLSVVDGIRGFSPTTRHPSQRIWGPVPAEKQPGWMVRMVMDRVDLGTFGYRIEYQPRSDPGATWLWLVQGTFAAAGGVRKGMGHLEMNTEALRAQGVALDVGLLDDLVVDYQTSDFPISVTLKFTMLPDPTNPAAITMGTYAYTAEQDGRGSLTFDFWADAIMGTPGVIEKFNVTSRWLGSGEGISLRQVISGDGAGLQQTECWDGQLQAVYDDKPWDPSADLGAPSACASIPTP
jgi:hypothetical protein